MEPILGVELVNHYRQAKHNKSIPNIIHKLLNEVETGTLIVIECNLMSTVDHHCDRMQPYEYSRSS